MRSTGSNGICIERVVLADTKKKEFIFQIKGVLGGYYL